MLPTEEIITVNGKNYCPICGKQPAQDAKDYKTLTDYLWDVLCIRQSEKAIDVARSEIIKKQEEDDEKRDKRNHKEEISADDIIDDGLVNTDFIGDYNFRREVQKQRGKDGMYLSELQRDIQEIMSEHPEEWEV